MEKGKGKDVLIFTVRRTEKIHELQSYLAKHGHFHLFVLVLRAGRVVQNTIVNYQVARAINKHTPLIIVATGCENYAPMYKWIMESGIEEALKEDGVGFNSIVASCFATGGRMEASYQPLREESRTETWDQIVKHAADKIIMDDVELPNQRSNRKVVWPWPIISLMSFVWFAIQWIARWWGKRNQKY